MTTAAHLATPEAFGVWAREHFNGVHVAELRPDGRGVAVAYARAALCRGYVVTHLNDGPADLHLRYDDAPCPGGIAFAYSHDGTGIVGFERTNAPPHLEQARREAHALADWLAAESEARS